MRRAQLAATSDLPLREGEYVYHILFVRSYLAAISSDDSLRLVDPASLRDVPNGHMSKVHDGVTSVRSPSKSSDMLVTAGRDARVKSWDLRSGTQAITFHEGMAFGPTMF